MTNFRILWWGWRNMQIRYTRFGRQRCLDLGPLQLDWDTA